MWQMVEVSMGPTTHRGRYRLEGRQLVLEWRGGRIVDWCGSLRPEVVASLRLKQLVKRTALAA